MDDSNAIDNLVIGNLFEQLMDRFWDQDNIVYTVRFYTGVTLWEFLLDDYGTRDQFTLCLRVSSVILMFLYLDMMLKSTGDC